MTTTAPKVQTHHTPGPWLAKGKYVLDGRIIAGVSDNEPHFLIAEIANGFHESVEANARLIAAAPELLEALKRIKVGIVNCRTDGASFDTIANQVETIVSGAIAKAQACTA